MEKERKEYSPRPSKDEYYMEIAEKVGERATCPRLHVGAVVVKDDMIVSTGYNGAPRGLEHCEDVGCRVVKDHCTRRGCWRNKGSWMPLHHENKSPTDGQGSQTDIYLC